MNTSEPQSDPPPPPRGLPPPWIALGEALRFLTVLPVPFAARWLGPPSALGVRAGLSGFPLAGWIVGGIAAVLGTGANALAGPGWGAFAALFAWTGLTLGLHLDGVADSCDALFSGRPRARKLEILKDSRIGAMGAIALGLVLLGAHTGLEALGDRLWVGALLAPPIARFANLWALARYPTLSTSTLGTGLRDGATPAVLALAGLYAFVPGLVIFGPQAAVAFVAAWVCGDWVARAAAKSLGGLSGDLYGLVNEVGQLAVLFTLSAWPAAAPG